MQYENNFDDDLLSSVIDVKTRQPRSQRLLPPASDVEVRSPGNDV